MGISFIHQFGNDTELSLDYCNYNITTSITITKCKQIIYKLDELYLNETCTSLALDTRSCLVLYTNTVMKMRLVTTQHSHYCSTLSLGLLRFRTVLRCYHTGMVVL